MTDKAPANIPPIKQYLDKYESKIVDALPASAGLSAPRLASIVMQECRRVPKLLQCNPMSLFGAVVQCAQLGLEPGVAMRQAYILPYGKEAQLIIGYAGMIALAYRSGHVADITPRAVFEGDDFNYNYGLEPSLTHKPCGENNPEKMTHVYVVVALKDGTKKFEVMTRDDVNKIRLRSKSGNSGPWKTDYVPMALKTVIRRVFKYVPISVEVQTAIGMDELGETPQGQNLSSVIDVSDFHEIEPEPEAPKRTNAKDKLADAVKREEPEPERAPVEEMEPEPITLKWVIGKIEAAPDAAELSVIGARIGELPDDDDKEKAYMEMDERAQQLLGST